MVLTQICRLQGTHAELAQRSSTLSREAEQLAEQLQQLRTSHDICVAQLSALESQLDKERVRTLCTVKLLCQIVLYGTAILAIR
jgi:chaperonin cofactor prefoldin